MSTGAPLVTRVLDLSRGVAGAYATRLLVDLGARATRLRWQPPRDAEWPASPGFQHYFDRGVEQVARALTIDELRTLLVRQAGRFDLVITDFSAVEAPSGEGLLDELRPFNPALVVANADHFGHSGPYARWTGDEYTDYALGGYWSLAGDPGRPPLLVPGYQSQFHAGMLLSIAALAALRHARATGEGQEVEVCAVEAMLAAHWSTTVAWTHEGRVLVRTGPDLLPAADGWVFFFRLGLNPNLFVLIERPDLIDDPRWSTIAGWFEHAAEIWGMVADWCRTQRVDDIVHAAQELRIPATPMATASSLLSDPQLQSRDYFVAADGLRLPGLPYRWEGETWTPPAGTEPFDDQQAIEPPVVAAAQPVTSSPGSGALPLAGLLVLELTNNWAGPVAGRHLGDLGAEVIKIELATKPATRGSHYPGKSPGKYHWNRSGYFNEMNRNKRGLSLNLATPGGRDLFLQLVARADIVLENNSARVLPNLGLGWDRLRQVNPRLVMASISGFGATGPSRDWVAYGSNIEAAAGLASVTGYVGDTPYRTGSFIADPIAGGHAVVGILAALERRDRTGEGAHLDIALTESALPFMLEAIVAYQENGAEMPRRGNADPRHAPTGAYRCYGADDWLAIAVRTDAQWEALCGVVGIDAALFPTPTERLAERASIDALIEAWTCERDQYTCARALQSAGVPAAPILHNWQLHSDPHLWARQAFIPIEHPDTGVLPYPGFPWRFSATPPRVRCAAPQFAEGNGYVFRRMLGLDDAAIAELYASGVTADVPEAGTPLVV
jgi:crotonobetainyl-CoA:carnitine CoA-transferase CaiB-like acyl-CoA transferase